MFNGLETQQQTLILTVALKVLSVASHDMHCVVSATVYRGIYRAPPLRLITEVSTLDCRLLILATAIHLSMFIKLGANVCTMNSSSRAVRN